MVDVPSRPAWRPVHATPWIAPARARPGSLTRFLATTWRLPTWVPPTSARHEVSTQLPHTAVIAALLRTLHGRLLVVNRSPVAAYGQADRALVRGLVAALRDGLPPAPWCAAPRDGFATWPADSRAAHAAVLAHAWLAQHDPSGRLRARPVPPVPHVTVALYEGPTRVALSTSETDATTLAPDVRARVASRLPGRMLGLPRVVATVDYRLVVVTSAAPHAPLSDAVARAAAALGDGRAYGPAERGAVWFSGSVLLPDPALVAVMDVESRRRWAGFTGRAGRRDSYWYPESWARFGDGGRGPGCVAADAVARSHRPRPNAPEGALAVYEPATERGLCVPPGYGLVDCVGTLGVNVVAV